MIWVNVTTDCGGLHSCWKITGWSTPVQLRPLSRQTTLVVGLWKRMQCISQQDEKLVAKFQISQRPWGHSCGENPWPHVDIPSWPTWSSFLLLLGRLHCFCWPGFAVSRLPLRMQCDDQDDAANVTWGSNNLGNTLWMWHVSRLEDGLFALYKPKYESHSHARRASQQSCRVHFVLLYFVCRSSVVDQRCSRMAAPH